MSYVYMNFPGLPRKLYVPHRLLQKTDLSINIVFLKTPNTRYRIELKIGTTDIAGFIGSEKKSKLSATKTTTQSHTVAKIHYEMS